MTQLNNSYVFNSLEACRMMGIVCTRNTADAYVRNINKAGKLKTSFKFRKRWAITLEDVAAVREEIKKGLFTPTAK